MSRSITVKNLFILVAKIQREISRWKNQENEEVIDELNITSTIIQDFFLKNEIVPWKHKDYMSFFSSEPAQFFLTYEWTTTFKQIRSFFDPENIYLHNLCMDPIGSLKQRLYVMSLAWCALGPFESIPLDIENRTVFVDVFVNDQHAKEIYKELDVAEQGYRSAPIHIALGTNRLYYRGWCMFEIVVRGQAGKSTQTLFLRGKFREGFESMEPYDIGYLLTFLVILFRIAAVPYLTYGTIYSTLRILYGVDLAKSNSLEAFMSPSTAIQVVCDFLDFLDNSFHKTAQRFGNMYGTVDEMEAYSGTDLEAIKERITKVYLLAESFEIKLVSSAIRTDCGLILLSLMFWLEPLMWILGLPLHILTAPIAFLSALVPWKCPIRHVEWRNEELSLPTKRFIDKWLYADGIMSSALMIPLMVLVGLIASIAFIPPLMVAGMVYHLVGQYAGRKNKGINRS